MDPFEMVIGIVALVVSARVLTQLIEFFAKRRALPDSATIKELQGMRTERKLLVERIENLETILCGVDLELNQKLNKLMDERLLTDGLAVAPTAPAPPAAANAAHATPASGATSPASAATAPAGGTAAPASGTATPASGTVTPASAPANAPAAHDRTMTAPPRPSSLQGLSIGDVLANRYRVQRLLGKGGMGAVYLAHDEVLGDVVALKVISSVWASDPAAMVERFKRECAAARKVSSPYVIRIHDLGEARPGLLYLSMEYMPGRTLSELIAARGMVPISDCIDILGQICNGLAAAHDAGVIHRDLKPSNVLVGERNAVKIIDFGLAKATAVEGLTATGMLMGTPHYMSPEQVRGRRVDASSDLYSLGALAYHLVAGRPPFSGENAIAVGFAHLSEPPTPPRKLRPDIPAELDAVIVRALAKDPSERPSSAIEMRNALTSAK